MPAVRILLLGDTGSGKSSLFVRFRKNEFSLDIAKTHGVNYHIAELRLNNTNGATQGEGTGPSYADVSSSPSYSSKAGGKTRVQLWDFAGKYRYKSMSKSKSQNNFAKIHQVQKPAADEFDVPDESGRNNVTKSVERRSVLSIGRPN